MIRGDIHLLDWRQGLVVCVNEFSPLLRERSLQKLIFVDCIHRPCSYSGIDDN